MNKVKEKECTSVWYRPRIDEKSNNNNNAPGKRSEYMSKPLALIHSLTRTRDPYMNSNIIDSYLIL